MSYRYKILVSYRGGDFVGWQRQATGRSVQQDIEGAFQRLTGQRVTVHGSGRTDAGVHARGQVAHFDLERPFPCRGLVHGGNHHLHDDVRVLQARRIASRPGGGAEFDALRSALSKEYRYRLSREVVLTPLDAPFVAAASSQVDAGPIRHALAELAGRHDFAAFAKSDAAHRSSVRTLLRAELIEDGPCLTFVFVGDGFLRGMVRGMVGTLLEIGSGRRVGLGALLGGASRSEAGANAPAHGLCLERVQYPPAWEYDEAYPDDC